MTNKSFSIRKATVLVPLVLLLLLSFTGSNNIAALIQAAPIAPNQDGTTTFAATAAGASATVANKPIDNAGGSGSLLKFSNSQYTSSRLS